MKVRDSLVLVSSFSLVAIGPLIVAACAPEPVKAQSQQSYNTVRVEQFDDQSGGFAFYKTCDRGRAVYWRDKTMAIVDRAYECVGK